MLESAKELTQFFNRDSSDALQPTADTALTKFIDKPDQIDAILPSGRPAAEKVFGQVSDQQLTATGRPAGGGVGSARRRSPLVRSSSSRSLIEAIWVFWPALPGDLALVLRLGRHAPAEFVGVQNYVDLVSDPIFITRAEEHGDLARAVRRHLVSSPASAWRCSSRRSAAASASTGPRCSLPVVFSLVVTALIWRVFYQPDGVLDTALAGLGLGDLHPALARRPRHRPVRRDRCRAVARRSATSWCCTWPASRASTRRSRRPPGSTAPPPGSASGTSPFPQLRSVNVVVLSVHRDRLAALVRHRLVDDPGRAVPLVASCSAPTCTRPRSRSRALGYASAIAVVIFVLALAVILVYLVRALSEEKES